jgi:hypothetical protein
MTFLTTRPGFVGDAARMSGYAVLSLTTLLSRLERRFEVRGLHFLLSMGSVPTHVVAFLWQVIERAGSLLREALEASPGHVVT